MNRLVICLLITLLASPVFAAIQGRGKVASRNGNSSSTAAQSRNRDAADDRSIGREVERIIREWLSIPSNRKGLPPGLAKKDRLPPGLQKQLERNGKLPPGLQKRIQTLPADLEARLPRWPNARKLIVIGGNLILLDESTSTILDIIADMF